MANNHLWFYRCNAHRFTRFRDINIFMIFPILCAAGYSGSMIIIKYTSNEDNVYTQTLHVYIATIILCPIITYSGFYLDMDNSGNEILEFLFRYWSFNDATTLLMLFLVGVCVILVLYLFSTHIDTVNLILLHHLSMYF